MGDETETKPLDPRSFRVSDEEREHVVAVLQKAIGRGMINLDEFTERTDIALAAQTRGDLNAVLADIPDLVHPDAGPSGRPYAGPDAPRAAVRPGQRLELTAGYSSIVRSGPWVVPPEIVVRNKYGATKLDFTQAQVQSPTVHIELDAKWGSVEVIIPEHAAVDLNSITEIKYASVNDRTGSDGRAGNPRLVFSGRLKGGSLTVRHPRRFFG
ncbi:DUF1707 SHOCT-like domain-containing protein [Amycolatopsis taiwanensis]|uniref:DUF1707 domain-containing protein n=1 Tax=Amycolatopsis taiwanensis TaxID=342230 RepID=A0A9W6R344_9PSEU|nr:DUF1707 domain-containing protein [Amycolatopsis taiwanensis]GLY67500.1 hypothetical protein Atai01_41190 [Amycolatopsis taiwanensis]